MENRKSNLMAPLGFTFAFLFPWHWLGLIFSIVGLVKAKKAGEGLIMSILGIIISFLFLAVFVGVVIIFWQEINELINDPVGFVESLLRVSRGF